MLQRFDSIVDKIETDCKTSKLIEDVNVINNQEVLCDAAEKEMLDKAIWNSDPPMHNGGNNHIKSLNKDVKVNHKQTKSEQFAYDYMLNP